MGEVRRHILRTDVAFSLEPTRVLGLPKVVVELVEEAGLVGKSSVGLTFTDLGALGLLDTVLVGISLGHVVLDNVLVDVAPQTDGAELLELLRRGVDGSGEGDVGIVHDETRLLGLLVGRGEGGLATAHALDLVEPSRAVGGELAGLDGGDGALDDVGAVLVGKGEVGAQLGGLADKVEVSVPDDVLGAEDDVLDEHVGHSLLQDVGLGLTVGETEGDTEATEGPDGHRVAVEGDVEDPVALDGHAVRGVVHVEGRAGRVVDGLLRETERVGAISMVDTGLVVFTENGVVGLVVKVLGLGTRHQPRHHSNQTLHWVLDVADAKELLDATEQACGDLLEQRVRAEEDGGDGDARHVLASLQVEDERLCRSPNRNLPLLPLSVDVGVTLGHLCLLVFVLLVCCSVGVLLVCCWKGEKMKRFFLSPQRLLFVVCFLVWFGLYFSLEGKGQGRR
mmetsp:Transcript_8937/g.15215  ORF Transcript_8937/g.15215 Transcript_8937/m.15215 type:complete len:450 (+) Transcript_8937:208-1557(+)